MKLNNIESWKAPQWHPDFGDPLKEFNLLVKFCKKLLALNSNVDLELDCFEEGYMKVDISMKGNKYGELYIVDGDNFSQYGLFLTEGESEEVYFTEINEGLKFFENN